MKKNIIILIFLLLFTWAANAAWARDVAIIVNKNNPTNNLSHRDLTKIFKLEKQFWSQGDKIYLIMRSTGNTQLNVILSKVFGMKDYHELKTHWLGLIFREELDSFPQKINSDEATIRFVNQVPNAITFITASGVDERVKVISIDGKFPGDVGYILNTDF